MLKSRDEGGRLSNWRLALFAGPAGLTSSANFVIMVFLAPVYAGDLGLSLAVVGAILFGTRLWDILTDGLVGALSDRLQLPAPRRKFWIGCGVPVFALGVWQLLFPPIGAGYFHLGVWLIVLYVGFSLILVNHMAWSAELSSNYDERSRIQSFLSAAIMVTLAGTVVFPALLEAGGTVSNLEKLNAIGLVVLLLCGPVVVLALMLTPDRNRTVKVPDWSAAIRAVARNRPFQQLLLLDVLSGFYVGVSSALIIMYAQDVLLLADSSALLLLSFFLAAIAGVPIWRLVSKRFEKHHTLAAILSATVIAYMFFLFLPPGQFELAVAAHIFAGAHFAAAGMLIRSMVADSLDVDRAAHGGEQAGAFFALYNLVNKLGLALPAVLIFPALEWFGFSPGADNTSAALSAFRLVMTMPVIVLGCLSVWIALRYSLTQSRQKALLTRPEDFKKEIV